MVVTCFQLLYVLHTESILLRCPLLTPNEHSMYIRFLCQQQSRKEENPEVVWSKFSTLGWAVFATSVTACHGEVRLPVELKTFARLSLVIFCASGKAYF
jgi:hypothetical protein